MLWIVEDLHERATAAAGTRRVRRQLADKSRSFAPPPPPRVQALTPGHAPGPIPLHGGAVAVGGPAAAARLAPRRNLRLEDRLRDAVMRRAFLMYYQPIVDARLQRPRGMEALLRWRTDDGEWISPSEFVPLAEASGLIEPLGQWILEEVCRQVVAWRAQGVVVPPVAVNLSPRQLRKPRIADIILDTLSCAGVEPDVIEFEITETCLMQDIEATLPTLHSLASAGIRLAIDDFGTGYSSLAYLRRLPIRKLKIDQSFVRGMHNDRTDVTIVSAVIDLARNLGLATVAEGVETAEQAKLLSSLGCDLCQGYLFHRPLPPQTLVALLEREIVSVVAPPAAPFALPLAASCIPAYSAATAACE
jgi:EAL domain-containing protein (putative c-di-GMP-specific phosphodiesterase class I)